MLTAVPVFWANALAAIAVFSGVGFPKAAVPSALLKTGVSVSTAACVSVPFRRVSQRRLSILSQH